MRQKKNNTFLLVLNMLLYIGLFYSFFAPQVLAEENESSQENASAGKEIQLVPLGNAIGVTLNMDGVMIVTVSEMICSDGQTAAPARDAGLKAGDLIKSVNGDELHSVDELTAALAEVQSTSVPIQIERQNELIDSVITPAKERDSGEYKLAAWVKDAASGIGTITFYNPQNRMFGALGHSITDNQTGEAVSLSGGNVLKSTVVAVDRGERGRPGELKGVFMEEKDKIGTVLENNDCGLFGQLEENSEMLDGTPLPIAGRTEVKPGTAEILSNVEGDSVGQYTVEIQKIDRANNDSHKDMVIKVTDPKLLEKTGGIVQGMSGSPIIQDGKLVGAVTHVFVNDPTRGYGVFIDCMLNELQNAE